MFCYECAGMMYTRDIGCCKQCATSCDAFKLCVKCAIVKNECSLCGDPLDAVKRPDSPDPKLIYIVSINVEHYCGKQRAKDPDAIARRNQRAITAFKNDVSKLVRQRTPPPVGKAQRGR